MRLAPSQHLQPAMNLQVTAARRLPKSSRLAAGLGTIPFGPSATAADHGGFAFLYVVAGLVILVSNFEAVPVVQLDFRLRSQPRFRSVRVHPKRRQPLSFHRRSKSLHVLNPPETGCCSAAWIELSRGRAHVRDCQSATRLGRYGNRE